MPIAGQLVRDEAFAEARAEFLAGYALNTARAYWSDLDDIWIWAGERGKNVLALANADVKAYVRLLRRRGYAASTIRRRLTALRGFQKSLSTR
jgi:site-specific recombinase XerD